jgi:hypothetical protein
MKLSDAGPMVQQVLRIAALHDFWEHLASQGQSPGQSPCLVSDLKRSIEVGERTKEISSPLGLQIRAFQDTAGTQELYKKWAWSPGSIQAVWTEWGRISEIASGILEAHEEKRFEVKSGQNFTNWIQVTGRYSPQIKRGLTAGMYRFFILIFGKWP